jgi:hypothetical protein
MTIPKIILLFNSLLFIQQSVSGQRFPSHIGIKGGMNASTLAANTSNIITSNYNHRTAPDFEIFIETKISKYLTFQSAGLEYSSQGAKREGYQPFRTTDKYSQYFTSGQVPKDLYANFDKELKLNYVFLTSVFRVSTNAERKRMVRPFIGAGFYTGYLLSAKEILKGSSVVYKDSQQAQPLSSSAENFNENRSIKKELHKLNVGLNGSIGLTVDIEKFRIYLEGGGNYGLININKDVEEGKNFIKSISGRIGFSYNIGQVLPIKF